MIATRQKAYYVEPSNLVRATEMMNCTHECFRSRVVQIVHGSPCTVIVEMEGDYPFVTNQWPVIQN